MNIFSFFITLKCFMKLLWFFNLQELHSQITITKTLWLCLTEVWLMPYIFHTRGNGDSKFIAQPRSPGPASRVGTTTTSPLHPRFSSTTSIDSPTRKLDECHPLPLPPGSPTSPSSMHSPRTSGLSEMSHCNLSKWKKGRLLGRGTFGHVYLGFNR